MNAGQHLLEKSSLSSGSARAHLTSAFAAGNRLVVNDGIETEVVDMTFDADIADLEIILDVNLDVAEIELNDTEITIEVEEW